MVRQNPSLSDVASARENLEQRLDETTLLPVFLARVPARMEAAISMIADGSITSKYFFHDHSFRTELDPTTGEQIPETVSLLDDLIEINTSSLPDLSLFGEGQYKSAQQPVEQLIEDFDIVHSVLTACRSDRADEWIRQSANDVELIATTWSAFAKRLTALQFESPPGFVDSTFLQGLAELENIPPFKARAACASALACLVHVLHVGKQFDAFERAVGIVLATPDTELICNSASSLKHIELRWVPYCAVFLMNKARASDAFYALTAAIGKAVGVTANTVKEWDDRGRLMIELRRLVTRKAQAK